MGTEITTRSGMSMPEKVVSLITEKNSDVDNAILMNKVNMIIAKTPKLATMPPESIAQAILKAMIPDPTLQDHDDIYFVPYGGKIEVSFSHNYLQKLAYRNGAIRLIDTILVYENDKVEVTEKGVSYSINPFKKDRGNFAGVMVIVKLANGETKYGFVGVDHIEKARKASKSGNNGPWKTWYFEMAKKVAIKNTLKGIDISPEFNAAVTIDNEDTDFRKQKQDIPVSGASKLEDSMKKSSKKILKAEDYLDSIGIVYEIKGDWIMISVEESNIEGMDKISDSLNKFITKEDRPGMLFGKVSFITESIGNE